MKKISLSDCHSLVEGRNNTMAAFMIEQIKAAAPKDKDGIITFIDIQRILSNTDSLMEYWDNHANKISEQGEYTKTFVEYEATEGEFSWERQVILKGKAPRKTKD